MFFGAFCALIGTLILKSKFLPRVLGVLMVLAGTAYWIDSLRLFLKWPDIPYILRVPLIAENSLALWLLAFGVNETKWRTQAEAFAGARLQRTAGRRITSSQHVYEVRPRKDHRGVDLISDVLPFGRALVREPNTAG